MLRIDQESGEPLSSATVEALIERAEDALDSTSVLVFQDYDKGVISKQLTQRLLERASELGIPTVVDPKLRHFFDFQSAHVIKPNIRELAAALGVEPTAIETTDLSPILERLGTRNLLLTLGEDGMLLIGAEVDGVLRVPSLAREVFDVTGAGDTVLAVIAASLVGEATLAESAVLATIAAGLEVSRLGAVPVTHEELLTEIAGRN
jgi:D-beta-D-heptose 7-phosphate kinase/D-beta-D-heptose 1-phosphate adenosyltransferase